MKYIFTEIGIHKINIIIMCLVLFLLCIQSIAPLYSTTTEGFENTKHYTFIHVPKTGGTAINKILENYSDNFDLYSNHFHNMVATKYNRPILCIREPTERFLSIYKYWKQHVHKFYPKINTSIKYFIKLLKENSKFLLFGNPPFLSEYHYFQQSQFIDPSVYSYSIVLIYDKEKMEKKINTLLKYLNLSKQPVSLPFKNVSKDTNVELDEEDLQFIQQKYYNDYQLWNDLHQHPDKFLKVI